MAFLDLLNQNQKRKPLTSSTAPSTGGAAAGSSASALTSKSSPLRGGSSTSPPTTTIAATATSTTPSKTAPLATSLKSGGAKPAAKASPIANQAPTAYDGTASTTESAVLQDKVPAALDPERGALTYQLVSGVAAGRLAFNANGSYSFNPGTDFKHLIAGETNRVTFSYQAIDNKGALSAPRTVTITIKGQNDALTPSIGLTPTGTYMGNRNPGDAALDLEFRVRADDMIHLLRLVRPDNTLWGGAILATDVNGNPYTISGTRPSNSYGNNLANAGADRLYGTADDLKRGDAGYVTNAMGTGAEQWANPETAFVRLASPDWGSTNGVEGIGKPRGFEGSAGVDTTLKLVEPITQALPNARLVSNGLGAQSTAVPNTAGVNLYHMSFGQYVDHGLDFTARATPGQSIAAQVAPTDPYAATVGATGAVGVLGNRAGQYVLDRETASPTFGQLVEVAYYDSRFGAPGLYSLDGTRSARQINGSADLQDWQLLAKNKTESFIQNSQLYGSSDAHEYLLRDSARYNNKGTFSVDGITYSGTPFELVRITDSNAPGGIRLLKTAQMLSSRVRMGDGLPGLPTYAEVLLNNGVNPALIKAVFEANGGLGAALGSPDWLALAADPRFVDNSNVRDFDPASPTFGQFTGSPLNGDLSRAVFARNGTTDAPALGAIDQNLDRIPDFSRYLSDIQLAQYGITRAQADAQTPIRSEDWGAGQLLSHMVAGDWRSNENIGLSTIHTMWAREHNFFVGRLKEAAIAADKEGDKDWKTAWSAQILEEDYFQMARILMEGEYQKLLFEEFVPALTGDMPGGGLHGWRGYDPRVDASISVEFAAVAYRVGHSQINQDLLPGIGLLDTYLNPQMFMGFAPSAIEAGLVQKAHEAIDTLMTDAVRNNLVTRNLDLFTANVLRGREMGLPSYQNFRSQLFSKGPLNKANGSDYTDTLTGNAIFKPQASWAEFGTTLRDWTASTGPNGLPLAFDAANESTFGSSALLVKFMQVYGSGKGQVSTWAPTAIDLKGSTGLGDIDLWAGMLAEKPAINTGQVGPSMAAVLWDQFDRLQEGDRFYYKDRLTGSGVGLWNELDTLSDIVKRNSVAELKLPSNNIFDVQSSNIVNNAAFVQSALGVGDQLRTITDLWTNQADPWAGVFTSNVGDKYLSAL
ncbi:MAG: VCBS domain-containing protein [Cyanobium usitatum Tobar12.5m-G36]|nr:VCBS domain-containing protein [Cyanobium usitatum Tobar12.5m-G36]